MNLKLSKALPSGYDRLLKVIGITTLIAGLSAAQTLPAAGPKRPAAVPANYVITPFGYFHPCCVGHLADGDTIRRDQNAIQHKDGSYGDYLQVCAFPHFKADGESVMGDEQAANQPAISHAWVEQLVSPQALHPLVNSSPTGRFRRHPPHTTARPCSSSPALKTTRTL